jgi:type II secretory pathway pseudopilin PulG
MTAMRRTRGEGGMSLLELLVSMAVTAIALLAITSVLASAQKSVTHQESLTQTLDQARLAVQQLDRELRSGNVLYDPALENAVGGVASCSGCTPGYTLRVYTQSNADTRAVGGSNGYRCVLWKIANQQVMTRYWPPLDPADASGWRVVATGVVNQDLNQRAFSLDPDPLKGGRTLNVAYLVNSNLTNRPTQTDAAAAALTGRNTSYGYPADICLATPSG